MNWDFSETAISTAIQVGVWSSGMILALGARGPRFNSQYAPVIIFFLIFWNFFVYAHLLQRVS